MGDKKTATVDSTQFIAYIYYHLGSFRFRNPDERRITVFDRVPCLHGHSRILCFHDERGVPLYQRGIPSRYHMDSFRFHFHDEQRKPLRDRLMAHIRPLDAHCVAFHDELGITVCQGDEGIHHQNLQCDPLGLLDVGLTYQHVKILTNCYAKGKWTPVPTTITSA